MNKCEACKPAPNKVIRVDDDRKCLLCGAPFGQRGQIGGQSWIINDYRNFPRVIGQMGHGASMRDYRFYIQLDCGHVRTITGLEYECFLMFPRIVCFLCGATTEGREPAKHENQYIHKKGRNMPNWERKHYRSRGSK
jgi:hypothetical protein